MTGGQDRKYQGPHGVTSICPRLIILADDLTGACDVAVAFTAMYDPVRVQINGESPEPAGIQAITTESRDLAVIQAEARIRNVAERLPAAAELFKKVDSIFRGNTIAEIAATLRYTRYDLAILAPAYPLLGRTVRAGVLHIRDSVGGRTLPLIELLAKCGCSPDVLPAGLSLEALASAMRNNLSDSTLALLCDATSQYDLEHLVRAARSLGKRILWIGSGGLAHALAGELPRLKPKATLHPRPGHTIFFIGSPHPVTRMQVEHLRCTTCITEYRVISTHSLATDQLIPIMLGETSADEIRRAVAEHNPTRIGCLFMTGGDTAHFVCRALGIGALRLEREYAPGVPLAIAEGGPFDGVSVVLKSGGFGEPDLRS